MAEGGSGTADAKAHVPSIRANPVASVNTFDANYQQQLRALVRAVHGLPQSEQKTIQPPIGTAISAIAFAQGVRQPTPTAIPLLVAPGAASSIAGQSIQGIPTAAQALPALHRAPAARKRKPPRVPQLQPRKRRARSVKALPARTQPQASPEVQITGLQSISLGSRSPCRPLRSHSSASSLTTTVWRQLQKFIQRLDEDRGGEHLRKLEQLSPEILATKVQMIEEFSQYLNQAEFHELRRCHKLGVLSQSDGKRPDGGATADTGTEAGAPCDLKTGVATRVECPPR